MCVPLWLTQGLARVPILALVVMVKVHTRVRMSRTGLGPNMRVKMMHRWIGVCAPSRVMDEIVTVEMRVGLHFVPMPAVMIRVVTIHVVEGWRCRYDGPIVMLARGSNTLPW